MKCFKFILIICFLNFTIQQWPKVENVRKSHYLPSLEVKIHPPDQFQPKVQAEILQLEEKRENNEKKWMQELEYFFNKELKEAGKDILKVIKDALSVFDDPNLLKKSVEYAINPPLIVMTNNKQPVKGNPAAELLKFKEVASFHMTDLQRDTMKILVEEDMKYEKLRGAKVSITTDDESTDQIPDNYSFKQGNISVKKLNQSSSKLFTPPTLKNGPVTLSHFDINNDRFISFVETSSKVPSGGGKYTKPISVMMKLPSDPDPRLKREIGNMEKKREWFEAKLFRKAKEEFKLITALTKKELQINLNHELLPFFVISRNALQGINNVIASAFHSQTANKSKFLQVDPEELKGKFPQVNFKDPVALNKNVYKGILNFFLSSNGNNIEENNNIVRINMKNKLRRKISSNDLTRKDIMKDSKTLDFSYDKCLELAKNLKDLNCDEKAEDYNKLNDYLNTSFLEMKQREEDMINVKFAASDEPYPTIEKLVAQMMTRRDLAEKFIRLKILEFESHLQKAENEMIQDLLHENLYRIMAFYGPSIEGMKEHIH